MAVMSNPFAVVGQRATADMVASTEPGRRQAGRVSIHTDTPAGVADAATANRPPLFRAALLQAFTQATNSTVHTVASTEHYSPIARDVKVEAQQ